jgi:hypothetical protein
VYDMRLLEHGHDVSSDRKVTGMEPETSQSVTKATNKQLNEWECGCECECEYEGVSAGGMSTCAGGMEDGITAVRLRGAARRAGVKCTVYTEGCRA